jgi:hypothetical protein
MPNQKREVLAAAFAPSGLPRLEDCAYLALKHQALCLCPFGAGLGVRTHRQSTLRKTGLRIGRGSVRRRYLSAHRTKIGGELAAMVDRVEQEVPEGLAGW